MSNTFDWEQVLEHLSDGVYVVDTQRRIVYWNRGAERITGYSREDVLGRSCSDNVLMHVDESGKQLCISGCPLHATLTDAEDRSAEVYVRHKEGHRIPVSIRVAAMLDDEGNVIAAVETFADRTPAAELDERLAVLERQAMVDPLTELANRRYCEQQLESMIEELKRYHWPFGVLFLDIDHFKPVNDTFGHAAGDHLLHMVGRVLRMNSRSFDVVGRWGGEEFIIACPHINRSTLEQLAERLRLLVEHSQATVDGSELRVTVSVGATVSTPNDTVGSLVARADGAMYKSKQSGRNRVTSL